MTDHKADPDDNEPPAAADHLTVDRPEQLQALGDPTRWRILGRLLTSPASIQELARALGAARGTIGHHVRVLRDAGLIRVVETKRVRGVTEKRYARVAKKFRLPEADSAAATADPTLGLLPLRSALAEARPGKSGAGDPSMSVVVRARMPAERARRFGEILDLLAAEFGSGTDETGETFGLVAAIYVPDWADGAQSEE